MVAFRWLACAGLLGCVALACTKTVTQIELVPVVSMQLSPTDTTILPHGTVQLRVIVLDTTGKPLNLQPSFKSGNSNVLGVAAQGLVQSLGPMGKTTITASLGGLVDSVVISVFDSSLGLAGRNSIGGRPYGAAVSASGVAYVTQLDSAGLGRANLPDETFSARIGVGNVPTELAFNSAGTRAYVTNQFDNTVSVVNVSTNAQIDAVAVTGNPFEVIVAPGDSILYVTTNVDSVYGIRLSNKVVITSFAVPNTANGLAVRGNFLYVSTWQGGTVVEFDLRTRAVSRTFPVGGVPQKLALSPDGKTLYIANEAGYVQFWDLVTGVQIGTNVTLPASGYGIALSPTNGLLYVSTAYFGGGEIVLVAPTTRTVMKTIIVGGAARRVVFSASGVGFVPNEGGWVDFLR